MLGAILTTILFSLSVIMANRSISALGSMQANFWRLAFAVLVLGGFAHGFGGGLGGAGRNWFFLSGVIGMGLGDLALYAALPRIGSRLSLLMTQCLAAPIAALTEWLWLDVHLGIGQILAGLVVLTGVAVALVPSRMENTADDTERRGGFATVSWLGLLCGLLSAMGQGLGAVASRKANLSAALAGEATGGIALGITAAYQRILAGFVIAAAWFAIQAIRDKRTRASASANENSSDSRASSAAQPTPRSWRSYIWVPLNALSGPILGVSCYQWALATTPSGIVLPIVACTPLAIIPFSLWLEGERPTPRSILGALIAVAGVIGIHYTH